MTTTMDKNETEKERYRALGIIYNFKQSGKVVTKGLPVKVVFVQTIQKMRE